MKKIYSIAFVIWSICWIGILNGYAQQKPYNAWVDIAPVQSSGYYNIQLDNRMVALSKGNLQHLSIAKKDITKQAEVPYFVRKAQPIAQETTLIDYPIDRLVERDSINRFVVHNATQKTIKDFYVAINKADVSINAIVKGSNNNKDWFIVKQKTPIYSYHKVNNNEVTLLVDFPEGQYTYYAIELINNQAAPLKVNRVSTVMDAKTYGQFTPTHLKFDRLTTTKKTSTLSFVKQQVPCELSKLIVQVNTPTHYYRQAILKDSITKIEVPFVLSSKSKNEIIIDNVSVVNPYIEIANADNQPLAITSIETYSLTRFLTAYLEENEHYRIKLNSLSDSIRSYDIEYFKDDIPKVLPIVQTKDFVLQELVKKDNEEVKKMDRTLNTILWIVIIVVGLIIALICYKTFRKLEK
ncbi:MAG: hypothetical protein LBI72_15265 [Flavobacteriaceae bacterium]|jgi:hypothetical protein|nr:hypothetical protein [Flavobacteriaceae bacterium]